MKTQKQIEERLAKKRGELEFEEERGLFPTNRAILIGWIKTLEWVLSITNKKD